MATFKKINDILKFKKLRNKLSSRDTTLIKTNKQRDHKACKLLIMGDFESMA